MASRSLSMPEQSQWVAKLVVSLDQAGPQGQVAARYIRERGVRIGLHLQPAGARWRLGSRIEIHPRYAEGPVDAAYPQSLVIHEVCHLQQGVLTALSVYGELQAWQEQFGYLRTQTGRYHEQPQYANIIQELMALPLVWDRTMLQSARGLMRAYAGRLYRVDLLPLYPLHQEILWRLTPTKSADLRKD
jgi:hypothetical protein